MADENDAAVVAEETAVAENQEQEASSVEERQQEKETNTEQERATEEASGEGDAGKEQPEKPKKQPDPFQKRIDTLTRNYREEQRKTKELEERLKLYEKPEEKKEGERPSQSDLERLAEQKAVELVSQREYQGRVNSWYQSGKKDFPDDFDDKCNVVASLGAAERPEFMQIITDPDLVQDGHKVVAALADDPQEASRILSLSPIAMSAALAKYADKIGKATGRAVSKAPNPMKPINGSAKANDEPSADDSEEEWFRKREAQLAARKRGGARF